MEKKMICDINYDCDIEMCKRAKMRELAIYIGLDRVPKSWYEEFKNINTEKISLEKLLDRIHERSRICKVSK